MTEKMAVKMMPVYNPVKVVKGRLKYSIFISILLVKSIQLSAHSAFLFAPVFCA
jgi:hypothetical protein